MIYSGHEYTLSNAKFALSVDPENVTLQRRVKEFERDLQNGKYTVPSLLSDELETNPFLRWHAAAVRQHLGLASAPDWKVFAELRERKDKA